MLLLTAHPLVHEIIHKKIHEQEESCGSCSANTEEGTEKDNTDDHCCDAKHDANHDKNDHHDHGMPCSGNCYCAFSMINISMVPASLNLENFEEAVTMNTALMNYYKLKLPSIIWHPPQAA